MIYAKAIDFTPQLSDVVTITITPPEEGAADPFVGIVWVAKDPAGEFIEVHKQAVTLAQLNQAEGPFVACLFDAWSIEFYTSRYVSMPDRRGPGNAAAAAFAPILYRKADGLLIFKAPSMETEIRFGTRTEAVHADVPIVSKPHFFLETP